MSVQTQQTARAQALFDTYLENAVRSYYGRTILPDGGDFTAACAGALRRHPMRVLGIDTETTGLDPEQHALYEVCVVELEMSTLQIHGTFEGRAGTPHQSEWSPQAYKMFEARKDRDVFAQEDCSERDIVTELLFWMEKYGLRDATIVGSNPGFDRSFLDAAAPVAARTFTNHRVVDTASMAAVFTAHWGPGTSRGLDGLRKHYRIPNEDAHTAFDDAVAALALFVAMQVIQYVGPTSPELMGRLRFELQEDHE